MNKKRLVLVVTFVCVAGMLSTGYHIAQVRADHCHSTNTATPAAPATPATSSSGTAGASHRQSRNSTRVLSINNKQFKTGDANIREKPETLSFKEIYSKDFPMAISSISKAVKAIKSGDRQTEVNELNNALEKLVTIYKFLGVHEKLQYANSLRCPIMGSPIDISKVDKSLTRDYKGRKIAFCCAGCPSAWDKLTEDQKQKNVPGLK